MAWKIRFGGHNCLHGSEHFPQLPPFGRRPLCPARQFLELWCCCHADVVGSLQIVGEQPPLMKKKVTLGVIIASGKDESPSAHNTFQPLPDYTVRYLKKKLPPLKDEQGQLPFCHQKATCE